MSRFEAAFRDRPDWVSFGRSYVASDGFKTLFRDGMQLVEETAAYLDGIGREEAQGTTREASLAYAGESMRLTTRLMQIASWLLVQRAVAEGEITPGQAQEERQRVKLAPVEATSAEECEGFALLPERLRDLVERSRRLHARIVHLDALTGAAAPEPEPVQSPVAAQQRLLRSAFGR